ncbi:MAG: ATPase [Bacteroidaceae bacterium]|nr:ATPase [Bacteroidaceae bacterium]
MILIADSGSTKTHWCLVEHGQLIREIFTKGTNPFFQTQKELGNELSVSLLPLLPINDFTTIHFYGAGCINAEKNGIVKSAIASQLHVTGSIEVATDMLGAARALCGHRAGIACIMGTGSNSCYYDGKKIVNNISPLGFILGDEGSGAVLGKLLVGDLLKKQLPVNLESEFLAQYKLTPADIIDKVYSQPFPNRFLASLSPFLAQHIEVHSIHALVLNSFKSFLQRNVMQYDYQQMLVHFIGSVAFYYQDILREAAQEMDIHIGTILKSPMQGLLEYHK